MAQAIFAAEARARRLNVEVLSAGVWAHFDGEIAVEEAQAACRARHTPMQKLAAIHISKIDCSRAARVFVMQHSHVAAVLEETPVPPERVSLLGKYDPQHRGPEIEDPIGRDQAAFDQCYERMRECIVNYLHTTDDFRAPAPGGLDCAGTNDGDPGAQSDNVPH